MARVLVSAYACEPGHGSEPGVGWTWVRALAHDHDLTVITRSNNQTAIERALEPELSPRLDFVYVDLGPIWLWLKSHGLPTQLYYLRWQWRIRSTARELSKDEPFDIAHHLTFAVDWLPAGVFEASARQRIWGPVGGSTGIPRGMRGWLPWRARFAEGVREGLTRVARRAWGYPTARRADLVLVQNRDGLRLPGARVVVAPNVVVPDELVRRENVTPKTRASRNVALVVGRLEPWKGVEVALAALTHQEAGQWRLIVVGDGSDRGRLQRLAREMGIASRVCWLGWLPRDQTLGLIRDADALVMPSLRESAGFVTAEAISFGVPVLALDHGGSATLVSPAEGITIAPRGDVDRQVATSLAELSAQTGELDGQWLESKLRDRLEGLYALLQDGGRAGVGHGGV